MPARKKFAPRPRQPRPELAVQPRRGRVIVTLLLCLLVFMAISQAVTTIFWTPNGIGSEILFALLYLVGVVYLLGIAWSATRLLASGQPSLQADNAGITLRYLPFLGTISLSWSEVKSVHAMRSLFLTHLCIVPTEPRLILARRNLLFFALNSSARLGMRTNTPLSISQSALEIPVKELVERLILDYGVKETA